MRTEEEIKARIVTLKEKEDKMRRNDSHPNQQELEFEYMDQREALEWVLEKIEER